MTPKPEASPSPDAREIAEKIIEAVHREITASIVHDDPTPESYRPNWINHIASAIDRERAAAAEEERQRIVTWLRASPYTNLPTYSARVFGDAIARGDHLSKSVMDALPATEPKKDQS